MSFILDALRKSETERRRTAAPMLAGVPVEVSRTAVPTWMWAVIVVLGIAVVALGGAWWTTQRQAGPSGLPVAEAPLVPAAAAPPAAATGRPQSMPVTEAVQLPAAPVQSVLASDAATTGDGRPTPSSPAVPGNASAPPPAAAPVALPQVTAAAAVLPTVQEVRAAGVEIPPLNLELHVYHSDPAARWVYINGSRYTEGRSLAAGPELVEIRPEGVVLAYGGREFLLLAQ